MGIRVTGIILSIVSISIGLIKPFEFVVNSILVDVLLVSAAVLIMLGELIVISMGKSEEIKTSKQRGEAIYDVISTGVIVLLFVGIYVVPFFAKHVW